MLSSHVATVDASCEIRLMYTHPVPAASRAAPAPARRACVGSTLSSQASLRESFDTSVTGQRDHPPSAESCSAQTTAAWAFGSAL